MRRASAAWHAFWFKPRATSTLALFRIGYGLVMFAWGLSLAPSLLTLFGASGVLPRSPRLPGWWGVPWVMNHDAGVIAMYGVLLVAALAVTTGYRTRLATVVLYVAYVSFQNRNPFLANGGDTLLRILGLYLVLAPSGVALSIDRWRRARSAFWEFPTRAPWALRLVQVQMSLMYAFTVFFKLGGETWIDGTAMAYALRIGQIIRVRVPEGVVDALLIVRPLTWAALLIEAALAVLIWNRRLRPWVLAAGVALHLSIEVTMEVGFFGLAVFVGYLAFIPEDTMTAWILRQRDHVVRFIDRRATRVLPARRPVGASG